MCMVTERVKFEVISRLRILLPFQYLYYHRSPGYDENTFLPGIVTREPVVIFETPGMC